MPNSIISTTPITLSSDEIRTMCINNQWFTHGNNTEYDNMFLAAERHIDIGTVANMISTCSIDWSVEEIEEMLYNRQVELSL